MRFIEFHILASLCFISFMISILETSNKIKDFYIVSDIRLRNLIDLSMILFRLRARMRMRARMVIKLKEGSLVDEELLDNDVILGYDSEGNMVSMEILDASRKGLVNALFELAKSRKKEVRFLLSKIND
jgi:uncharacterized protein YuzE